jgi:hypothetical protein
MSAGVQALIREQIERGILPGSSPGSSSLPLPSKQRELEDVICTPANFRNWRKQLRVRVAMGDFDER